MRPLLTVTSLAVVSAALVSVAPSASATRTHHPVDPIRVIASGLEGPYEVQPAGRDLLVTESGAGRVVRVDTRSGTVSSVVDGLGPSAASGATQLGWWTFIVTGASEPTDTTTPSGPYPGSSVLVAKRGKVKQFADLEAAELKLNPDGQTQFGPDGTPLDALSNPFSVIADPWRLGSLLVADGGANVVWRVGPLGKVTPFFVPPTVNTGACEGRPNNDENTLGCDAVPTGLAYGPGNSLYVSALTGEAPGEGRVYVLNAWTGKVKKVISGFDAPTGVAVRPDGTLYVSEVLEGAPAGEPGPDFDPATVGQLVKVTPSGKRTTAQVTMPTGVLWQHGRLYSSAWSIAGFFGMEGAGQVVEVSDSAFE